MLNTHKHTNSRRRAVELSVAQGRIRQDALARKIANRRAHEFKLPNHPDNVQVVFNG